MMHGIAELAACGRDHLDTYSHSGSNFAFWTYDRWYGSPDTLTPQVLDATKDRSSSFHKLSTVEEWPFSLVLEAVDATADVYGWRGITVTKVLHRLRPHLVPLVDSVVQAFYGQLSFPAIFAAIHRTSWPTKDC